MRYGRRRLRREANEQLDRMTTAVTVGYSQAMVGAGLWRAIAPRSVPARGGIEGDALWNWAESIGAPVVQA